MPHKFMGFWEKIFNKTEGKKVGTTPGVSHEHGRATETVTSSEIYNRIRTKVEELGGRMTAIGHEDIVVGLFLPLEGAEEMKNFLSGHGYLFEGTEQAVLAEPGRYMSFVVPTDDGRGKEYMFRITIK